MSSPGAAAGAVVAGSPDTITIADNGLTSAIGYGFQFASSGKLTVNPAPLTVTANDAGKVYDGQAWSGGNGVTYSGFVNHEDALALGGTLTFGGDSQGAKNVGSYAIAPSGLTSGNYAITFNGGTLAITSRALTVTALGQNKVYDGTTAASVTYGDNRVAGDDLNLSGTALFGDKDVGIGKTVSVSGIALGGADAGNYTFNTTATTSANITPRSLTITANDATKTYGGVVTFAGTEFAANGLLNGESIGSVTLSSLGAAATAGVSGSPYAITASNAGGGAFNASNHTISYTDGHLMVNRAPLTVTADAQTRMQDNVNPPLAYWIHGTLFNGDTLGGGLATGATPASPPGASLITQGTLKASDNYTLTYKGALLTVTANKTTPTAVFNVGPGASRIVFDSFYPVSLPDNARPVFGAPSIVTSRGIGVLYADPRLDTVFICFGGGGGTAQACFAAHS